MKRLLALPLALAAVLAGGAAGIVQDQCGPFTDVTPGFCPYVLDLYYLGITVGTSATTFSPDDPLTRGQAAVFVAKGLNQSLARSSHRAALGQWWTTTPQFDLGLGVTQLAPSVRKVASDGADIWVAARTEVYRVRASDGKLLETWTGVEGAFGILVAMGRVFVSGAIGGQSPAATPGVLYMIDPSQPAGPVMTVATDVGDNPTEMAFDGTNIWIVNPVLPGSSSIAIVTPGPSLPWSVNTVTTGISHPFGIVFDGSNIWVADADVGDLLKLDANGGVLQAVHLGTVQFMGFDGTNIWVPGFQSVTVVAAKTGAILANLTGNGIEDGDSVAFDGQRIMVTSPVADTVSLFNAADFSPLGSFLTGPGSLPYYACSDGINFWISLLGRSQLVRF